MLRAFSGMHGARSKPTLLGAVDEFAKCQPESFRFRRQRRLEDRAEQVNRALITAEYLPVEQSVFPVTEYESVLNC